MLRILKKLIPAVVLAMVIVAIPAAPAQAASYKLPWVGTWKATQGLHSTNAWDFQPSGAGSHNDEVLAVAGGRAWISCTDSAGQASVKLSVDGKVFTYMHLQTSAVRSAGITTGGVNVAQGQALGRLFPTTGMGAKCGRATASHLHLEMPTVPIVIDGVTFSRTGGPRGMKSLSSSNTRTTAMTTVKAKKPSIRGVAAVGATLSAVRGNWSPGHTVYRFQWLRDGVRISGATDNTYKVSSRDVGAAVAVQVTGSAVGHRAATTRSVARYPGRISPVVPKINGYPRVGNTLSAIRGTWNPASVQYRFQWLRDGKPIQRATAAKYTLNQYDQGHRISVRVYGSKANYELSSRTSPSQLVVGKRLSTVAPKISGTKKSGHTLKAAIGNWSPRPSSYRVQWYRNGKPIKNATRISYRLNSHDAGKRVTVRVWGLKAGYQSTYRTSTPAAIPA